MGGGDDGGYSARQAQQEAEKQRSRDALNVMFGVAPSQTSAPSRDAFMRNSFAAGIGDEPAGATEYFDQTGFDAAKSAYASSSTDAAKNKTARDALYQSIRDNAFTAGKRGLDEDRTQAARDLRFALFAQGLNGGSVDIDQNATLGRTYDQGVLSLGSKADAARTDFANRDEQTRLGLLQSIDAGMDQGSALSSAITQLKLNNDRAASDAQGTALGDLFEGAGLLYTKSNAARGKQEAGDWFASNYPSMRLRTTRNSGGIITPTGG